MLAVTDVEPLDGYLQWDGERALARRVLRLFQATRSNPHEGASFSEA